MVLDIHLVYSYSMKNSPQQLKIFLVDDDPFFLALIQREIEKRMNAEIIVFEDAESCLENLDQQPDVIFLDYMFGEGHMSGLSALQRIKTYRPEQNVVLVSGKENLATVMRGLSHGASNYLIKTEFVPRTLTFMLYKMFNMDKGNYSWTKAWQNNAFN